MLQSPERTLAKDHEAVQPTTETSRNVILSWVKALRRPRMLIGLCAVLVCALFLGNVQTILILANERDYIVASLQTARGVAKTAMLQLVPPEFGHTMSGVPFFTYGKAVMLWLRCYDACVRSLQGRL